MKDLDQHNTLFAEARRQKHFFDVCFELIFTFLKHVHLHVHTHGYPKISLLFSTVLCDVSFIFNTARAGGDTDGTFAMAIL